MQTRWQSTLEVAADLVFSLFINIGVQLIFYQAFATAGRVTLLRCSSWGRPLCAGLSPVGASRPSSLLARASRTGNRCWSLWRIQSWGLRSRWRCRW